MEGVYEEILISPDGSSFEVTIKGVKGSSCTQLQEKYGSIGQQTHGQLTGEYYEQPGTVQQKLNVTRS